MLYQDAVFSLSCAVAFGFMVQNVTFRSIFWIIFHCPKYGKTLYYKVHKFNLYKSILSDSYGCFIFFLSKYLVNSSILLDRLLHKKNYFIYIPERWRYNINTWTSKFSYRINKENNYFRNIIRWKKYRIISVYQIPTPKNATKFLHIKSNTLIIHRDEIIKNPYSRDKMRFLIEVHIINNETRPTLLNAVINPEIKITI